MNRILLILIVAALLAGVVVGALLHHQWLLDANGQPDPKRAAEVAGYFKMFNNKVFLPLIKTIVAPLVLATLSVGIAHLGGGASLGRIGLRSLLWFIAAGLVSLTLGLIMVNVLQPGVGFHAAEATGTPPATDSFTFEKFLEHLFPVSFANAMLNGENGAPQTLQVVLLSCLIGLALSALGQKAGRVTEFLDQAGHVMLKVTGYVMLLAPFAVFAAMAAAVTQYGLGVLVDYGRLVGSFFLALLILWALLITAGFLVLGPRVFGVLWAVRGPGLLAFATASSEAAYPKLLENLEKHGVANRIVSFVLPLGYSFNLDGSMMYCTFASLFIAQALGVHMPIDQQVLMLLLLMVTSKGIAGVPRASLVVIAAALPLFGIKAEAISIVIAVDAFMDMGRTATNVIGNSIACAVIARWEGLLREPVEEVAAVESAPG
ncbi:MAG TPA: dicarboxylate/amino acid:cation symporter [Hyphomonadaceae bacterium]|nr:dicarboxylate/amino acid:cation symporter [Hyphomonadaceae bacterium]